MLSRQRFCFYRILFFVSTLEKCVHVPVEGNVRHVPEGERSTL